MIIVRSPLRITLGGGGTDLPSFYRKYSGFLIAAAIDKYVYVTLTRPFKHGIYLKYSSIEKVKNIFQVKHPIIREVLKQEKLSNYPLEITTLADIPSGTGLGSSGSFTTALIKALYYDQKKIISPKVLAEKACKIEIEKLKDPVGKQDQYISSYGGLTCFEFKKNEEVKVQSLKISHVNLTKLENNILLFFTGYTRQSKIILKNQKILSDKKDANMLDGLKKIKKWGYEIRNFLEKGDLDSFGYIMREHWEEKKKRSNKMTNSKIDFWYNEGIKSGALGGKLIGAGGGGFLMFYAKDKERLESRFTKLGLEQVKFKFDFEGTKVIMS
jgi:D-glycero-alpha-D-manno-heptose-7-phosphate kinase